MRDTMTIDNAIGGGILWFTTVHVYPDCTRSRQIQNPIPPADLLHISARTDAMRWFAAESRLKTLSPWALVRTAGSTILSVFQINWNPSTRAGRVIFIFLTRRMDWHTEKGTHGRANMMFPYLNARALPMYTAKFCGRNPLAISSSTDMLKSGRADGTRKLYQGSYYGRRGRDGKILPYPFFCPVGLTAFTTKHTPVLSMYI